MLVDKKFFRILNKKKMNLMNDHIIKVDGFIKFNKTDEIVSDMKFIIDSSQKSVNQVINTSLIYRNWLIEYRIA